ncbi:host attachment family protein [Thalassovita taeanensis]|uniref:Protein required for attachment to host cells n=1 Tax=Thalassovita taeanensis TaxID=657014 RepID=A0A1H9HVL1_9RHOB|nr:host attachment family protein [Thalassovita taeanensis]SEQ66272.1 Protein required for attachment to host cells [Thalassovita taeanensis]
MTKLTQGTWVLVADGKKALFLENITDEKDPNLKVVRVQQQDNPRDGEQTSDRPGHTVTAGGGGRRAAMEGADWHQIAEDTFAAEIADILYQRAHAGAFRHLVLVAPPKTLGELRKHLHAEVTACVVAEIAKDLTNHPMPEVEKLVKADIAEA